MNHLHNHGYEHISVIVHGPVLKDKNSFSPEGITAAVIQSVRRVLPGAKVILSTWIGEEANCIKVDKKVHSIDPGALPYGVGYRLNNVNRQIVAMRAGLNLVETNWTLKLRSDTILTSDQMVKHWECFPDRSPFCKIFEKRVVTSAILTYDARLAIKDKLFTPFLFHVNDMIQFGLTKDIKKLWSIPTMVKEDFTFFTQQFLEDKKDKISNRRVPEDYIWTTVLTAAGMPVNESWADIQPQLIPISELSIVNNFILLDHKDMGFKCLKYPNFEFSHPLRMPYFTHIRWRQLYKTYCNPLAEMPSNISQWKAIFSRRNFIFIFSYFNPYKLFQLLKRKTRFHRYKVKKLFRD